MAAPSPVLVLMVGLPGSGKSTWLAQQGVTPLSSDYLRLILLDDETDQTQQLAVFTALRYLLRVRLSLKRLITWLDATNLNQHERSGWFKLAASYGCALEAVFMDVPLEVCLQRNAARNRKVPLEAMHKLAAKLRPPTYGEGFRRIVVVDQTGRARLLRRPRRAPG